ncbi:DNA-directed RNA polymerase subunit B [Candidatus Woesearchaeota archaeon]|jgi:DNA-directed RNA polymerase subunit B'|nr:DNA-directed RNA polymerase subunit B [Candidatus Woesearchaeota archaeon]MBT3438709.1 DNA-directed RNA polymerase subunit B [Candidatus Woesearchaeota archaeon]MBT4058255.1 DNA-directed RNA polymerase subunit B [Candidatus Woesearchaeota archaeon]MBT4206785.1 DNA-directed RNA polymerase subunit B [Candidatus Woesearchaeota archaeon]MBT4731071.1 DNA-directed RNA polymerase subunit B [Candidatus Woesearchaeota archaeon]
MNNKTDVYMREIFIGQVDSPEEFIKKVKQERRDGKIPDILNINYNKDLNEVIVEVSRGRSRRPVIIVENGKSKLTEDHVNKLINNEIKWADLKKEGIIEYLDAAEEENCFIALSEDKITNEHSHLEISPILIMGLTTSIVPFSNYGQSARLNRGSKSQKQSLGLYASNYLIRIDTDANILHYPSNPIVKTCNSNIAGQENHPAGQNLVIALMSYEGYNMQDALILNNGSLNRGMGRSTYYKPYSVEELRYSGGLSDKICIPDKEVKGYKAEEDYKLLEEDGIVYPEAKITEADIIIGRTSPPRFLGEMDEFSISANRLRDSSVKIKPGENGIVDMVVVTDNDEGNRLVQLKIRHDRVPEIGDKFASRHGQKGVVGLMVPQQDMPFTVSGITPDLIFSPHSIPSRMTVSHLIEAVAGKAGALHARTVDASAFSNESEESLREMLTEMGFREDGTERMINGITGEEFEAKIFIGNMFYLRLKHMVGNKLHARGAGRIQLLTRQPIEGRAKGGGLRLGEMEKDCFVAHGASLLLKERFDSDRTVVPICSSCGLIAVNDIFRKKMFCHRCGGNVEVNRVEMSYAFKLLMDEIRSMGIIPSVKLKNKY